MSGGSGCALLVRRRSSSQRCLRQPYTSLHDVVTARLCLPLGANKGKLRQVLCLDLAPLPSSFLCPLRLLPAQQRTKGGSPQADPRTAQEDPANSDRLPLILNSPPHPLASPVGRRPTLSSRLLSARTPPSSPTPSRPPSSSGHPQSSFPRILLSCLLQPPQHGRRPLHRLLGHFSRPPGHVVRTSFPSW